MNIMTTSRTGMASGAAKATLAGVLALLAVSALSLIGARPASAATVRQWKGAGADGNWTNPANWVGGAPVAGDILDFGYNRPRKTNVNDFPADTTFGAITFSDTGYVLTGNRVRLTNGVTTYNDTFSSWTDTLNLAIVVANNQNFTAGTSNDSLTYRGGFVLNADATFQGKGQQTVSGPVTGPGAIVGAAGNLFLAGTSASTGETRVTNGYVYVTGNYSGRPVSIAGWGGLAGSGTTGPVSASPGDVAGGTPPAIPSVLKVTGDLKLSFGELFVLVNGSAAGQYGQVVVSGKVTLGDLGLYLANPATSPIVVGQVMTIIKNNGSAPVSGTFHNLPEGSTVPDAAGNTYRVSYKGGNGGRDITLTGLTTV